MNLKKRIKHTRPSTNSLTHSYYIKGIFDVGGMREDFSGYLDTNLNPEDALKSCFKEGGIFYENIALPAKRGGWWISYAKVYASHRDSREGKTPLFDFQDPNCQRRQEMLK